MKRIPKSSSLVAMEDLHTAVATDDLVIVHDLIRAGAAIDQRDEFGSTPLHRAAWQGDISIVQTLLAFGAKADAQRKDGKTPLDLVELRARGAASNPPAGLSPEAISGDFSCVSALLTERTP